MIAVPRDIAAGCHDQNPRDGYNSQGTQVTLKQGPVSKEHRGASTPRVAKHRAQLRRDAMSWREFLNDPYSRMQLAQWRPGGPGTPVAFLEGGGFGSTAFQLARAGNATNGFLLQQEREKTTQLTRANSRLRDETKALSTKLSTERARARELEARLVTYEGGGYQKAVDDQIFQLTSAIAQHKEYEEYLVDVCRRRANGAKNIPFSTQPIVFKDGLVTGMSPSATCASSWTDVGAARPSFGRVVDVPLLVEAITNAAVLIMRGGERVVRFESTEGLGLPACVTYDDFVFARGSFWQATGARLSVLNDPDAMLTHQEKTEVIEFRQVLNLGAMIANETKTGTVRAAMFADGNRASAPGKWAVGQHHWVSVGGERHLVVVTGKRQTTLGCITDEELRAEGLPCGRVGIALLRRILMSLYSAQSWIADEYPVWVVQFRLEKFRPYSN